jgi:hypothetical protein
MPIERRPGRTARCIVKVSPHMSDVPSRERELLHALKNQLSIVVGFSDLVYSDTPPEDPRHADLAEIRKAARAAMAIIPELAKQMR